MIGWLERNRSNLAALLVVLITVAAAVLLQLPRRPVLQVTSPTMSTSPPPIKVHVVGAVRSPGVYQLPADARVEDALNAAGGPSESVDASSLNLAAPLRDGQQLAIPHLGGPSAGLASSPSISPSVSAPSASPRPARLDLNTASRAELEALPGIGPVTAQKILDYRQKNGYIGSVEELRDAKVLNSSMYEKIRELVEPSGARR